MNRLQRATSMGMFLAALVVFVYVAMDHFLLQALRGSTSLSDSINGIVWGAFLLFCWYTYYKAAEQDNRLELEMNALVQDLQKKKPDND